MEKSVKLGLRLQAIAGMVTQHYDHIWDCCCDHGMLGMQLLEERRADKVHFVDVLGPLVEKANAYLSENPDLYPSGHWQTLCEDVAKLPIHKESLRQGATHLVIIAGIGGDLSVELVEAISDKHPEFNIEFLLCPVRQHHHVRENLIRMGIKLIDESLMFENRQPYEILHVARHGTEELTTIGSTMWNLSDESHYSYLQQTIAHYQRRLKSNCQKTADILEQYKCLLNEHSNINGIT